MNVEVFICAHTPMSLATLGVLLRGVWVGFFERDILVTLLLSAISPADMLVVGLD